MSGGEERRWRRALLTLAAIAFIVAGIYAAPLVGLPHALWLAIRGWR